MQSRASYRVLCVCLGNICRSPTAEVVLAQAVQHAGLSIEVDSAGTSNYHPNQPPDRRSIQMALRYGYDLSSLRARQIIAADFDQFDLILAMDEQNLADLTQLQQRCAPNSRSQLSLFSAHDAVFGGQAVPDPYYGGPADFERVVKQCETSAAGWISFFQMRGIG